MCAWQPNTSTRTLSDSCCLDFPPVQQSGTINLGSRRAAPSAHLFRVPTPAPARICNPSPQNRPERPIQVTALVCAHPVTDLSHNTNGHDPRIQTANSQRLGVSSHFCHADTNETECRRSSADLLSSFSSLSRMFGV